MTITLTRSPRTELIQRTNWARNPNFESAGDITGPVNPSNPGPTTPFETQWLAGNPFGAGGAGSQYVGGPGTYATVGNRAIVLVWSTAPTGAFAEAAGFQSTIPWPAGEQRRLSGWLFATKAFVMKLVVDYYNNGTYISSDRSGTRALVAGQKTQLDATITPPAGTTTAVVYWTFDATSPRPANSDVLALDAILLERGGSLGTYFDGDTWASGHGDQRTYWTGTPGQSTSVQAVLDPANIISPQLVEGWDQTRPTRNAFFDLLDGTTAIVQAPVQPRSMVLKLKFGGDGTGVTPAAAKTAADTAESQLKSGAAFFYNDTSLGALGASLVAVNGDVRLYSSNSGKVWQLDVPVRELL